jgi:hypothetical protein
MIPEPEAFDTQDVEPLAALERFVVDNDDLLALESLIGKFNIFDALDIARVEIRHSNFLAFILDPAESHGQGQLFLKAVLMDLLKAARAGLRPLSPIDLDGPICKGWRSDASGATLTSSLHAISHRLSSPSRTRLNRMSTLSN